MSKAAYPKDIDLVNMLQGAGLALDPLTVTQAQWDFDNALQTAIDSLEIRTGWRPFVGASQTRTYDPPGSPSMRGNFLSLRGGYRFLEMDGGLLSAAPVVTVGINPGVPGSGTVYTQGTQYWLRPTNALLDAKPYRYIEFIAPIYGYSQSITVAGTFGYSTTLPDSVWRAVLCKAAVELGSEIAGNLSLGLISWKQEIEAQFGANPLGALLARWDGQFEQVVERFRRRPLGLPL